MPFLYLIVLAVAVAAICAALAGVVISIIKIRRTQKPYPLRLWIPAIVGVLPLLFVAGLIFGPSMLQQTRSPSDHFERVFSVAPAEEIRKLKSEAVLGLDSGLIFLAYNHSDQAWATTIRLAGNPIEAPNSAFVESFTGGDAPGWWKPGFNRKCQRLETRNFNGWDDIAVINCKNRIYVLAGSID